MPACNLLFAMVILFLVAEIMPAPSLGSKCSQTCGKQKIIFPFYLKGTRHVNRKPVCGLRGYELDCRGGSTFIVIGQPRQSYKVLHLGPGELRINPLPSNSCTEENLRSLQLSGTPFRLSPRNMLQLYSCTTKCRDCSIPLPKNYSVPLPTRCTRPCCESLDASFFNSSTSFNMAEFTGDYQNLQNYTNFGCSSFTSWAYSSTRTPLSFHAEYGLMLNWFVKGNCSCAVSAVCSSVQGHGYTCTCKPGYVGDGYANGNGCRPGVIIAAFILGVAMIIGAILLRRRSNKVSSRRVFLGAGYKGDVKDLNVLLSGLEHFTYKQLDKATKGFASSEKLGTGSCGTVYAAKLEDGRWVAVKRLHYMGTQMGYQQTLNELCVLSAVKHRNLVTLLGCCLDAAEALLVFEYVSNGTLAEHLQRERGDGLDWFTRLTIAAETADALAYLHTMEPPVLHRDVKSRNILLDHDFNTKVADFGLSRMGPSPSTDGSHISTVPQGTPGYLDPEYHQNFHLSDKSDVYSFGVVLIEIITALKPVDFSRDKKQVNLAALAVEKIGSGSLDDIIDPHLQVHKRASVKNMVHRVAELAFRCLAYDKDARPAMTEVLEELLLIRGSATSPLLDAADHDSERPIGMDAQSSQRHELDSSLSSSEANCYLLAKPQSPVYGAHDNKTDNTSNF
ncbi:hypothetical protein KP509_08G039300 [Ceratopteris richardii]|uniref:Protein kinase domain-containing protein n=1 Tax=Ceratopteris richardii TaxID=49495 RepID=A0A8T2U972_CERRI|nr:hypothetical protein KP509_08G039300 [Ceratopteris richardii]